MARELSLRAASDQAVVKITCPSLEVADRLASRLVEERLAACVNLIPGLTSVYHWQGEICRDQEVLLLAKTTLSRAEPFLAVVAEEHPYEVPEVLWLRVEQGSRSYLDWLERNVVPDTAEKS